jgi:thiosulfate/3-mercaptopyruvate sulfurtransferase
VLISATELRDRLADPRLRMADVRWFLGQPGRGREEYDAGHVPGAVFVDVDQELVAAEGPGRHPLPDPAAFARSLEALGFGSEHVIVAYDQGGGTIAARLWWMLDALGHPDVALLDGGLPAWVAAGGELTTEIPTYPPARLDLATEWPRTIDRTALTAGLEGLNVLDVRAPERYRGETEPIDPVAGHVPSAVNLPTTGNLGPDGRFLEPEALLMRFGTVSDPERPTVVHCGSGINACHTAFAMRLAGLPDPLLYPGSYSDWSRSGMPVATGSEPGKPEAARSPS